MLRCAVFFLLVTVTLSAQEQLIPVWTKTETSNIGDAEAWGLDVDDNGVVYWATSTEIDDLGLDIKCYAFESDGNPFWAKPYVYEGGGTQHIYICKSDENSLFLGGRNCPALINTCDMYLQKIDKSTQALVWETSYNFSGNGYDEVDGIYLGEEGIICSGWAQELQSTPFQSEMGLWNLDYDGNTMWTNHFGQQNTAEHLDGHLVVDENNIYACGLWGGKSISNLYNGHSFIGKFSKEDGSLVDSTLFGTQSERFLDIENALGMTTDGEYLYVTGYATPASSDDWQLFLSKFDKDLNLIWNVYWGEEGTESGRGIAFFDGRIYVAGLTESEEFISGNTKRSGVLLSFNQDGNILDAKYWGTGEKTNFHDLVIDQNNVYITGTIEEQGKKSGVLIAKERQTLSTGGQLDDFSFTVSPNPVQQGNLVTISRSIAFPSNYIIFGQNGSVMDSGTLNAKETNVELDQSGTYFLRISNGFSTFTRRVVVQ